MRRKLINTLLRVLYFLLLKLEVEGTENVPASGPLILMINHIHALDPFIVVGAFPRLVTPMSKIEVLAIPVIGLFTRAYGVIPIRRGVGDMRALRQALDAIQQKEVLLIAPEGTRSPTHSLQRGKEGMALIAARTGAPIIPVAVTGTEKAGHYWRRLRRVPVRIVIGEPFHLVTHEEPTRRPILQAMTHEAMYRLAAILPPAYRGVYRDLHDATETHIVATPFALSSSRISRRLHQALG
jgi:1-acyl-sn-glycerol-3-phosphate acyltransferase